jgi:hypothetical protein
MHPRLASFAFIVTSVIAIAVPARAQQAAAPPERMGLEVEAGLQAGKIFCNGPACDKFMEAGGLNLNASYFVRPDVGLYAELWVMTHTDDDLTFSHFINTLGVKWRPVPVITIQAGVGQAHATIDYSGFFGNHQASTDNAFAVMGAASLDLVRSHSWAIAFEIRGGTGFYGNNNSNPDDNTTGRNVGVGGTFTYFGF